MTTSPYASAQLRIHTLSTGTDRLVLESSAQLFEAPNWTPDGQWLIVNSEGSLYRVAVGGGMLEPIATTPLADLNNDHVLAPDGSTIFVSAQDGHIYAVPLGDGVPVGGAASRVTNEDGPDVWHYLHGVSPDATTLAYVRVEPRDGVPGAARNVFTIPAVGGADVQLTDSAAPDDGPEYSPDGQWIYLNSEVGSTEPGHAQIFRMRTDGSELTQLTSDVRVNWFPHLSPDGRVVLFVSFPPGTQGHPAARPVILRTMSADGEDVTDVVELHGGQGTLNVNSWAPDSDQFAYVAYTSCGSAA